MLALKDSGSLESSSIFWRINNRLSDLNNALAADFEKRIFAAQQSSAKGGALDTLGATGGPGKLRDSQPGALGSIGTPVWSEFAAWDRIAPEEAAKLAEKLGYPVMLKSTAGGGGIGMRQVANEAELDAERAAGGHEDHRCGPHAQGRQGVQRRRPDRERTGRRSVRRE